jgi:hypothetical protein
MWEIELLPYLGRDLTGPMLTAIGQTVVRPAIFYEGEFVDGSEAQSFLRFWTGVGEIAWGGYTWIGGGKVLSISPLEETTDLKAVGFSVTLSGMPSALISLALSYARQGKPGKLWLGLFDSAGALLADPYPLRRGRFDIAPIEDNGETCTISAQYEDRLIDLERPRDRRYTHEDQQLDYPGDRGFEYVPSLQNMDITWGRG